MFLPNSVETTNIPGTWSREFSEPGDDLLEQMGRLLAGGKGRIVWPADGGHEFPPAQTGGCRVAAAEAYVSNNNGHLRPRTGPSEPWASAGDDGRARCSHYRRDQTTYARQRRSRSGQPRWLRLELPLTKQRNHGRTGKNGWPREGGKRGHPGEGSREEEPFGSHA